MARPYKYVCKYYSKNNGAHYTVHSNALGVLKEGFWVTEEGELVVKHSAPEFKNINLEFIFPVNFIYLGKEWGVPDKENQNVKEAKK